MKRAGKTISFILSVLILIIPNVANAVVPRVSYTASLNRALNSGESVTYTFELDEPIICSDSAEVCEVSLTFTNNNSSATTLNQNRIVWADSEWRQTRTIILSVRDSITYQNNSSVSLTSTVVSNAEYYRNFAVSVTATINLPESPEQKAAREAAEAAEAARLRQIEIDRCRELLFAKLKEGKRPTFKEYSDAYFPIITQRIHEKVTDQLLLLPPTERILEKTINTISEKLAFYDDFFSLDQRPKLETYSKYGIHNVSERTLNRVNLAVLEIPENQRSDTKAITEIIKNASFVDMIANPNTRKNLNPQLLINFGLLKAESPFKRTIINGLSSYSESQLDTFEEIRTAVNAQVAIVSARQARTAKIIAKIRR